MNHRILDELDRVYGPENRIEARRTAAKRRRQKRREAIGDTLAALFVVACGVGLLWVGSVL